MLFNPIKSAVHPGESLPTWLSGTGLRACVINRYALLVTVISLLPKEGFKEIEDFYRPEAAIEKDTVV